MAEYDGEIRIGTDIDDGGFVEGIRKMASQSLKLGNQIKQTQQQIRQLEQELKRLSDTPVETKEFAKLKAEIAAAEDELDLLYEKRGRLEADLVGPDMEKISTPEMIQQIYSMSGEWKKLTAKIAEGEKALEGYQIRVKETKAVENAQDSPVYQKKAAEIEKLNGDLEVLKLRLKEVQAREKGSYSGFSRIKAAVSGAGKAMGTVGSAVKKLTGHFKKLGKTAGNAFKSTHDGARRSSTALGRFGQQTFQLLASVLFFNFVSTGFRLLFDGIGNSIKEFAKYNATFNTTVSALKSSLSTLQRSFAAAFAPIVQVAAPYLIKLINLVTRATNAVAQLVAALTGKSSWHKAVDVQEDYAGALDDTAAAADAAKKSLADFDELNVQSSNKETGGASGGGATGPMWEEVPIDEGIVKWAEKLKKLLGDLFKPLKKAWNREGKFVVDSWKFALEQILGLVGDIGRDLMTVWQQDETVNLLADVLHILGDIGLIIGNLVEGFREAWNSGETGLHILENIRDIIGIIVKNVRGAADATADWAKDLDFTPLLAGFERLTESLKPFADFVSGTLADFYTNFILPFAKWSVETGLPEIEEAFADFFDSVDWEGLRTALSNLYTALEPYAEEFAQGLIDFFKGLLDIGSDFLNGLPGPIQDLANALNDGDPERARKWGENLGKLAVSLMAFKVGGTILLGLTELVKCLKELSKIGNIAIKIGIALAVAEGVWKIWEWLYEQDAGNGGNYTTKDVMIHVFWDTSILNKEEMDKKVISLFDFGANTAAGKEINKLMNDLGVNAYGAIFGAFGIAVRNTPLFKEVFGETSQDEFMEGANSVGKISGETLIEAIISGLKSLWHKFTGWFKSDILDWMMDQISMLTRALNDFFGTASRLGRTVLKTPRSAGIPNSFSSVHPREALISPNITRNLQIPALATGTVIPPGMGQFLAVLGDNNRETEIVSPISAMKQAFKEAFQDVGGGGEVHVHVHLEGDAQGLFREVKVQNEKWKKQHGGKGAFN